MARNGAGTGSPPVEHRPQAHLYQERQHAGRTPTDQSQQSLTGQRTQGQRTVPLTPEQRAEWKSWLETIFAQKGWRKQLPTGRWLSYYAEFDRKAGLPVGTMNQYVHRGYTPSMPVVMRMAAALGISPLAIMYRSFQITFDQFAALIGGGRVLVTREETQASLDALRQMPGLPRSYYQQMEHRFIEDYRFSEEMRELLSPEEFEQLRDFLTERGREQTRRDVLADATPLEPLDAPDARGAVFGQPLLPASAPPFGPESAVPSPATQPPHRRPPVDDPVWSEDEE